MCVEISQDTLKCSAGTVSSVTTKYCHCIYGFSNGGTHSQTCSLQVQNNWVTRLKETVNKYDKGRLIDEKGWVEELLPFILKRNIWRMVTTLRAEIRFNILSLQLGQTSKVRIFFRPTINATNNETETIESQFYSFCLFFFPFYLLHPFCFIHYTAH